MPPSSKARRRLRAAAVAVAEKRSANRAASAKSITRRKNRSPSEHYPKISESGNIASTRRNGEPSRRKSSPRKSTGAVEVRNDELPQRAEKVDGQSFSKPSRKVTRQTSNEAPASSSQRPLLDIMPDDIAAKRKRRRRANDSEDENEGSGKRREGTSKSKRKRHRPGKGSSSTTADDGEQQQEERNEEDKRPSKKSRKQSPRIVIRLGRNQPRFEKKRDDRPPCRYGENDETEVDHRISGNSADAGDTPAPSSKGYSSKRKVSRRGNKSTSSSERRKKKTSKKTSASEKGSTSEQMRRKGIDDDEHEEHSSEDDSDGAAHKEEVKRRCAGAPKVGEKIAIKCPADPPLYPAGWYSATVLNISLSKSCSSKQSRVNYTAEVEWDGGGIEELSNPEWRVLGEEPDQRGRTSQRDAKLRPYIKHWVRKLRCIDRAESQYNSRQQKSGKEPVALSPLGKVEWIQCANPGCGKWRSLPRFLDSATILRSCNNTWYCVLNNWDDSIASCHAPQESGQVPVLVTNKQETESKSPAEILKTRRV